MNFESDPVAFAAIWKWLGKLKIYYYENNFLRKYSDFFLLNEIKSLDDAAMKYMLIEGIDHEDPIWVGEFCCFLMNKKMIGNSNYYENHAVVHQKIKNLVNNRELIQFEKRLNAPFDKEKISIHDTDMMSGIEFEDFLHEVFIKISYYVNRTAITGDQGVDLIVSKNSDRIAVQAKCYSGKVGNSAIQEVVAGSAYHGCSKGMVITNSYFTGSAEDLAIKNNIVLWDRDKLEQIITELF